MCSERATAEVPASFLTASAGIDRIESGPGGQADPALVAELLGPRRLFYDHAKRVIDVIGAAILIVLTAPVMAAAALAIKLTGPGPVLFCQNRLGQDGRPFRVFKFRSMRLGAEDARPMMERLNERERPIFKIKRDPRVTRVGRFLRRSSIDELPQLFNILRGEMSLVGPRPLWINEARAATGRARLRMAVKPGLTCLWQISGRSELSYDVWIDLDLHYIRHRSIVLDLQIILQTLPAVMTARGAY